MASSFTSQIPDGTIVKVRIIDSTSKLSNVPVDLIMGPPLSGFDTMPPVPTWSFLIEHNSGRKLLFDLGIPVDWRDLPPNVSNLLSLYESDIEIEKSTKQILGEQGLKTSDIEAIIWSHWHWDHIGNPSHFPSSTKIIVGPGFKAAKLPAYPSNPDADLRQSDFAGRELVEISFKESDSLMIGPFEAHDYFRDGSFYLLNTPGHAVGHLSGLARTTNSPSTFILMGGDLIHHSSQLRPSPHNPLPDSIPYTSLPSSLRAALGYHHHHHQPCTTKLIERLQTQRARSPARETPLFEPTSSHDLPETLRTILKAQEADADENLWYIAAHDVFVRGVAELFPAEANEWKGKGWRERSHWRFLGDFEAALREVKLKAEREV